MPASNLTTKFRLRIRSDGCRDTRQVILKDIRICGIYGDGDAEGIDSSGLKGLKPSVALEASSTTSEGIDDGSRTIDFVGVVHTFAIPEQFVSKDAEDMGVCSPDWGRVTTNDGATSHAISEFLKECRFETVESASSSEVVAISDKAWLAVQLLDETEKDVADGKAAADNGDCFVMFYFTRSSAKGGAEDRENVRFMATNLALGSCRGRNYARYTGDSDVASELRSRASAIRMRSEAADGTEGNPIQAVGVLENTLASLASTNNAGSGAVESEASNIICSRVTKKTIETMVHAALRLRRGQGRGSGYSNSEYAELWANTVRTVEFIYERHMKKYVASSDHGASDIDKVREWVERCLELFGE